MRARGLPAGFRPAPVVGGAVLAGLLGLFVGWPLVLVLARGAGLPAELASADSLAPLGRSLAVATVSTVLAVALGGGLAYAIARTHVPGKRLVAFACEMPAVLPPFFVALALLLLFGEGGVVTRAVGWRVGVAGFAGIVLAQTVAFLPDAFLVLLQALLGADAALEEAALNLGASPPAAVRQVTLALVRPAAAAAALSVFVLCLSDFGIPYLIGGGFGVLTTEIYARASGARDLGAAAVLSVSLLIPCLVAHALRASRLGAPPRPGRWSARPEGQAPLSPPLARRLGRVVAPAGAGLLLCLYGGIALGSVAGASGAGLSTRHYRGLGRPLVDSLVLVLPAAAIGSVVATAIGRLASRSRAANGRLIERWAELPAAVSGTVLGLGYLLAFGRPEGGLVGGIWILLASVAFGKLPRAVAAAVELERGVPPALEEAARSLGAGPARTFVRVTLPCLVPAGIRSFVELCVDGLATVSALVLLVPAGFAPLSVASLDHARRGDLGLACALGTVLGALSLGAALAERGRSRA